MVNSNQKITQFLLGSSIGFCLAMFFPINSVWSQNTETIVASESSALLLPSSIVVGIALFALLLHLILALLLTGLNFWKIVKGKPSLETLKIAMIASVVGGAIGLLSFKLSSPFLNSIALVATIINSATLLGNFLATFVVDE